MADSTTAATGWTCTSCGMFIHSYQSHVCGNHPYNMPSTAQLNVWPCFGTIHEYAVGPTHAICNRCSKVVKLDG